jgi:hypothetical protein
MCVCTQLLVQVATALVFVCTVVHGRRVSAVVARPLHRRRDIGILDHKQVRA